jgi:hypothetical protein
MSEVDQANYIQGVDLGLGLGYCNLAQQPILYKTIYISYISCK